ncbi:MAG: hypothetical protein RL557_654 [archaeon]|jgi:hypothetical protein
MDKKAKQVIGVISLVLVIIFICGILVFAQSNILKGAPNPFNKPSQDYSEKLNLSSLNLINRSLVSDSYYDPAHKKYYSVIYPKPVNIKNLEGKYEPYEIVTDFIFDEDNLILSWNDKSVTLEVYTKNSQGKKEKIKDKVKTEKDELDLKTDIQKGKGYIYYNHTLNKNKQPSKIGYDLITENVNCKIDGYKLICDEQVINFEEAVFTQNLSLELKNNYIEFSGDDLSYIDPSITLTVENASGDWGQVEYRNVLNNYNYDDNDLTRIGAEDNVNDDLIRGWVIFDVDIIDDTANINDADLYLHVESSGINTAGCSDSDIDLRFYEMDAEDFDETPDTEDEELWMWNNISADTFYGAISSLDSSDQGSTISKDLGPNGEIEVESLIDGVPEDEFMVGIKVEPSDEVAATNCNIDIEDTPADINLPYLVITYTIPDIFSPSTTASATSPPGGASYVFGNITNESVQLTLCCSDSGSGCKLGYPKYCLDITNTCSPLTNYSSLINISTGGVSYIRYQSYDIFNNSESIQSKTIKINKNYTQNVSLFVNNVHVWNHSSYFARQKTSNDFSQQLNDALSNCTEDALGYCIIPLIIHSDSEGRINLTSVNIYFNITEYRWNSTGLSGLSTYKTRIKATDGLLNSSYDGSDSDFSIGTPNDTHKYFVKDSSGNAVAWLGSQGNIVLRGRCFSGGSCNSPGANSFIIANNTDDHVAFINSSGDLCIEKGDCSDQSTSCNPMRNAFIIRNSSNYNMSYIDFDGDLCLTGRLYEHAL